MAAINGVKKSAVVKKGAGKRKAVIFASAVSVLVTLLIAVTAWKFVWEGKVYDRFLLEAGEGSARAYKALRDIAPGEGIDELVAVTDVPGNLAVSNALTVGTDLSGLKASGSIAMNAIITNENTYDPEMQDVKLNTSREIEIDYLKTPGIEEGDYVDIRLRKYGAAEGYRDEIVCSKKEIFYKDEAGNIRLMLSESELLNINGAVMETAYGQLAEIYVTKYVDPANQSKASVTYTGKGIAYTEAEIKEAQQKLREMRGE